MSQFIPMPMATLTSRGRITIPKDIRDRLGMRPGVRIEFVTLVDGAVRLLPRNLPIGALKGILPRPKRPVSINEMNQFIAGRAVRRRRK